MLQLSRTSCAAFGASLLAASSLFTGCADPGVVSTAGSTPAITVTGNWQISSSATAASRLPALSGALTGTSAAITGLFHSKSATACIAPTSAIAVSGSADANKLVTLTGTGLNGGTLTISGTLAADGKSLTNATYNVTGGTCAFASAAPASAQVYSSVTGNYTGTFTDNSGMSLNVTATLTQNPNSDTNGDFQVSGTGNFNAGQCIASPASISNSQVTGGNFSITYTDGSTANSVTASGNFSTDGKVLTVTQWTLAGACGPDTGTGLLTRQ